MPNIHVQDIQRSIASEGYADITRSWAIPAIAKRDNDVNGKEADYHFIISNEDTDSHGTVFLARGCDLNTFRSNPFVTYQHPWLGDTNSNVIIGKSPYAEYNGNSLEVGFNYQRTEEIDGVQVSNMTALDIVAKLNQGILSCASIYARAYEGNYGGNVGTEGLDPDVFYFTRWELITWGVVIAGSNAAARLIKKENTPPKEEEEKEKEEEMINDDAERQSDIDLIAITRAQSLSLLHNF